MIKLLDKLRKQADMLVKINSKKYTIIQNILKNDNCFFEMSIEESYAILRDLKVKEEDLKLVYMILISKENYH